MSGGRTCHVCGCSETSACLHRGGPCYWVAPALCSACTGGTPRAEALPRIPRSRVYGPLPGKLRVNE